MKKLILILGNTNWIEATWVEEVITTNEVEKEGKLVKEESVTTEQVHCESFSGHREHIQMLRAKAVEFYTSLDEYEAVIAECESKFEMPTDEKIQAGVTANLVAEAKNYLASTDYKMTVDYFATLSEAEQNELITKRAEAREFIRGNN